MFHIQARQRNLIHCSHQVAQKSFVDFQREGLHPEIAKMRTRVPTNVSFLTSYLQRERQYRADNHW